MVCTARVSTLTCMQLICGINGRHIHVAFSLVVVGALRYTEKGREAGTTANKQPQQTSR